MQQLGRIVRRYWLVLLALVVVGAIGGYFGARLIPPTYTATATQLVKGIPGTDATANYQAAQYAISRARTYPVFIDSQPVLEGVRVDFGGRIDVGDLQERLSSSNPIDTPLVQVTATARTPEEARDMANSAARHLARYITQIETVNGSSPVNVEVAVQATRPSDPTAPRPLLIAALVAFAAGCLGLAGVVVFDRVLRPYLARRRIAKAAKQEARSNRASAESAEMTTSGEESAAEEADARIDNTDPGDDDTREPDVDTESLDSEVPPAQHLNGAKVDGEATDSSLDDADDRQRAAAVRSTA